MKQGVLAIAVIALLILAYAGGYYFGNQNGLDAGKKSAEARLEPIINSVYPKPADDIRSLRGTIQGIYGGTISLQVVDPNDYIPHADGSPRKTDLRSAITSAQTKIVSIDYTHATQGVPKTANRSLNDLKVGMRISVFADHNIKNESEFSVTRIELTQ